MKKIIKKLKKVKKNEKVIKKKRNALWITVVIHSDFGCGGIVIPPHHLDVCIMLVSNIKVHVE